MIGARNSVVSCCKDKNLNIFIEGCPYNVAHLVESEVNYAFREIVSSDIEFIIIDVYYWFDKS